MVTSCSDHAQITLLFAAAFHGFFDQILNLHFEEVSQKSSIFRSWTLTAGVFCMVRAMNLSHVVAFLVFTDAFLMAGTILGELFILQVYKTVAWTMICEAWHCPCYCVFLVMFVCSHSGAFCVSRFALFVFCEFPVAGHLPNHQITQPHRITSHDLTTNHIAPQPHNIPSLCITSHHITWQHITSHRITSCHITSRHITRHDATSNHTTRPDDMTSRNHPHCLPSQPSTLLYLTSQPTSWHHTISHRSTSHQHHRNTTSHHQNTTTKRNGWRLVHTKNSVWTARWSPCANSRGKFFLWLVRLFPLKLPRARPGTRN